MFGLDKLFGSSGLLGGFFDSIGMPWMNNVLSLATNVMTGNWLGAAKDVFNLVSQFSNSWQNQVDRFQPLGQFGNNSCFGGDNSLSAYRTSELQRNFRTDDGDHYTRSNRALDVIRNTAAARETIFTTRLTISSATRA
jgi:hypothetical protein